MSQILSTNNFIAKSLKDNLKSDFSNEKNFSTQFFPTLRTIKDLWKMKIQEEKQKRTNEMMNFHLIKRKKKDWNLIFVG